MARGADQLRTDRCAMSRARKSWREKLMHDKDLPKVVRVKAAVRKHYGIETMLIAAASGKRPPRVKNFEKRLVKA